MPEQATTDSGRAKPRRRTQAERSATTRAKVIEAAAHCISENGFHSTTTAHIARRAGVTWGAIQHQFGDKDAIFSALIEQSMNELQSSVRDAIQGADTLEQRVEHFVQGMWRNYQTPIFRAVLEILLGSRSQTDPKYTERNQQLIALLINLFNETFEPFDIPQRKRIQALRFALGSLAGFALEETFNGPGGDFEDQLITLSHTLTTTLG